MRAPATWRTFAEAINGEIQEGSETRPLRLVATLEGYDILYASTLGQEYDLTYTVLAYATTDDFQFHIRTAGLVRRILRRLGGPDVSTGDSAFDRAFIVRSNDRSKVQYVLAHERVRRLLHGQAQWGPFTFKAHTPALFPERQELLLELDYLVRQVGRLETIHDLFHVTLDRLRELGSARPIR